MSDLEGFPSCFDLLAPHDQQRYLDLREAIKQVSFANNTKINRNAFADILSQIRYFCQNGDDEDHTRMRVCGASWIPPLIAIHTSRLRYLLGVSKASILRGLQKIGYQPVTPDPDSMPPVLKVIPSIMSDFSEIRCWGYYEQILSTPQDCFSSCFLPALNYSPSVDIESDLRESDVPQFNTLDEIADFFKDPYTCSPMFLVQNAVQQPTPRSESQEKLDSEFL